MLGLINPISAGIGWRGGAGEVTSGGLSHDGAAGNGFWANVSGLRREETKDLKKQGGVLQLVT